MEEKDLKVIMKSTEWLGSIGEHTLANNVAYKVLLHLKMMSKENKSESVREIESALKKTYASEKDFTAPVISQRGNGYWNILFETFLKTSAILLTIWVFLSAALSLLNVNDHYHKALSRSARGDDRNWNRFEAAVSRNPYLYYRSALLYEEDGNLEEAIFQMEKAISLAPHDERYLVKLKELQKMNKKTSGKD